MQIANNRLGLLLRVRLLIQLVRRINSRCVVSASPLTHLTVESLRRRVLIHSRIVLRYRPIQISLRMNATHFFLGSNLSNTVQNRPDIDISYFYSLIALYFKLLANGFGRSLNSQGLLRAALSVNRRSHCRLPVLLRHIVVLAQKVKLSLPHFVAIFLGEVRLTRLLEGFINLDWRHQLPLRQQSVHLLHKL